MTPVPQQVGSGLLESVAQAATVAGSLLLALMLVALGTYAYKQLRGGGVEWPDEEADADSDDGAVTRGDTDDEWDYY